MSLASGDRDFRHRSSILCRAQPDLTRGLSVSPGLLAGTSRCVEPRHRGCPDLKPAGRYGDQGLEAERKDTYRVIGACCKVRDACCKVREEDIAKMAASVAIVIAAMSP